MNLKYSLKNKKILITGGTGSWGNELTRQLLSGKYEPAEIVIYSRGEMKQVEMKRKFKDSRLRFIIGDVRDSNRLVQCLHGIDLVFHAAALKHVPICEENSWEAVQTNTIGTQNVIDAAIKNDVERVVFISSDKAVDPYNIYGVTKACAEHLIASANMQTGFTKFITVRGGNVSGSNGSVIPLFREQMLKLNMLTITDERMTRFMMSLQEAIGLLLRAATMGVGGEVIVMNMGAFKLTDMVDIFVKRMGNKKTQIKKIGIRPGEKIHEILVSQNDTDRTYDLQEFFVTVPNLNLPNAIKHYQNEKLVNFKEFTSATKNMTQTELEKLIEKQGWFEKDFESAYMNYLATLENKDLLSFQASEGWFPRK